MSYYPKNYMQDERLFERLHNLGLWTDERWVCCMLLISLAFSSFVELCTWWLQDWNEQANALLKKRGKGAPRKGMWTLQ